MKKKLGLIAALVSAALALTACGSSNDPLSTTSPAAPATTAGSAATGSGGETSGGGSTGAAGGPIIIGSADFTESAILAEIYAAALKAKGIDSTTKLRIGAREAYMAGMKDGSINLVPEYTGVLLQYLDPSATATKPDEVYTALQAAVAKATPTLTVLDKSEAEDKDTLTVTQDTATKNNLKSIADLKPVAGQMVLGGPSEWKTRPTGVPGLEKVYGLTFKEFKVTDAGGPLTIKALQSGLIQAGNVFSTDAAIKTDNLVALEDPEALFGSQNVVPLIATSVATPEVTKVLNAVSAKLTTDTLIELNAKAAGDDKEDPAQIAQEWVASAGL
jgi:osmoprotectant transport system substrate-binding protein